MSRSSWARGLKPNGYNTRMGGKESRSSWARGLKHNN